MLVCMDSLEPPQPGGSRTFRMATWNIVDRKRGRLAQAAAGLAQMGVDIAVLQETKFVNKKYTKSASGYTTMCLTAVSIRQGGVDLLWKDGDSRFEVELAAFRSGPKIVTFQVNTGDRQYYVI